jgi:hypothetical protein
MTRRLDPTVAEVVGDADGPDEAGAPGPAAAGR